MGRPKKAATHPAAPAAPKTRDDTKQAKLIAMLPRKEGATIAQIVAAMRGVMPALGYDHSLLFFALGDSVSDAARCGHRGRNSYAKTGDHS